MNFFSHCLFSHGDRYHERNEAGKLELVCSRCGHAIPVLASEVLKGPKFHQDQVLGQPRETAQIVTKFGNKRKIG